MSEIGDELRQYCDGLYKGAPNYMTLMALADRINAEMAELPLGKDGKPIRVGETVYGEDGKAWHVEGITLGRWARYAEDHVVHATGDSDQWRDLLPEWLTHERPDSLEQIAREIEEADVAVSKDWAARIRRLAEREDGR